MALVDLIRDGLWDKCAALEARLRDEERLRRENNEIDKRQRVLALVDAPDLAPKATRLSPSNQAPKATDDDLPTEVYEQYVEDIFKVTDPVERRMASQIAIQTIREHHPLTAPDDCKIERRLNELLTAKLRESPQVASSLPPSIQPPSEALTNGSADEEPSLLKRVFDGFLPKQIDPASIKTFGSTERKH